MGRCVRRIAFLARVDPDDIRGWSGVPYHMVQELRQRFESVVCFHPPPILARFARYKLARLQQAITGKRVRVGRSRTELFIRSRYISKRIRAINPDALFVAGADDIGAFLRVGCPVIHHSDATFRAMRGYYPGFTGLNRYAEKLADQCADRCIRQSSLNIYPSHWAANSALEDYHARPETVHVVPYGSNIDPAPSAEQAISTRDRDCCRLLMIGGDWKRKRGDIAVQIMEILVDRGIDTRLDVIGRCPMEHPRVHRWGFLNKGDPEQLALYTDLWSKAHFFVLPTKAECFGMVFAEAAAWGVPAISCLTGGVPEAVDDGVTGELIPVDAHPSEYAQQIERLWRDKVAYKAMQMAARARYDCVLNWTAWGDQVESLIRESME